jgi:CheY-like chemotaxis protein
VKLMDEGSLGYAAGESEQHLKQLKLLVIERRETNRWALTMILGAAGASVTSAESLSEALAYLAVRPFDAILTDIEMPGVGLRGGRPVLAGIAGPNACAPVLSITGHEDDEDVNHAAGMMMEIGGFLDPARIFGELCRVERRQIRAAA